MQGPGKGVCEGCGEDVAVFGEEEGAGGWCRQCTWEETIEFAERMSSYDFENPVMAVKLG